MFDYQAGEKYKITLIMVAIAGMMGGIFFSVLLMPTPDAGAAHRKRGPVTRAMSDPDVTGYRAPHPDAQGGAVNPQSLTGPGPEYTPVNPADAANMVTQFSQYAFDLNFQSARASQERAIHEFMTPECAQAYRQNIWKEETAQQVEQSGLQSTFQIEGVSPGNLLGDGSIEVELQGKQTLGVGANRKTRAVKVRYLIKNIPGQGPRIAGISEVGK
jgi:hypothetical protein